MTQTHVMLPPEAAPTGAPQAFGEGVFPGVFAPGAPVALAALGLSADEAAARIEAERLPLVLVTPKAERPARTSTRSETSPPADSVPSADEGSASKDEKPAE